MIRSLPKQCPACRVLVAVPRDEDWLKCPHCGEELRIHHKYVAISIVLSYLCGFLLALPEHWNIPVFIFAGLSCGFLLALFVIRFVLPRLPLEVNATHIRALH